MCRRCSGRPFVFAPARTPEPALARLVEAFRFAMGRPEVLQRLAEMDTIAQYLPPAELREDVASYMRFWSGLVDRMGLRVEG